MNFKRKNTNKTSTTTNYNSYSKHQD